MHLAVRTKGHPVQVLSHDGPSLVAHDLEAVDRERQLVPALDPVEQSFSVLTHRGAIAGLVVGPRSPQGASSKVSQPASDSFRSDTNSR
jgi:hypothetical protein